MKKCYQCKESKPVTEYYKNRSRKDGLSSTCKTCCQINEKIRWQKQKQQDNTTMDILTMGRLFIAGKL